MRRPVWLEKLSSRPFVNRHLTILQYRRISATTPFDTESTGPGPGQFREQLLWLKKNVRLVSELEVRDAAYQGTPLPARSVLVTLDECHRDQYDHALPILSELQVPALFFVPTEAILERRMSARDLVAHLVRRTMRSKFWFRGLEYSLSRGSRRVVRMLQQEMLRPGAGHPENFLLELGWATRVRLPVTEVQDRELMNWAELREIAEAGFGIGSLGHSQTALATLDWRNQRRELVTSRDLLRAQLPGTEIRSMAYPLGGYEHFYVETQDLARSVGYEIGFSCETGLNNARRLDSFDLRRVAAPKSDWALPSLFAAPRIVGRRRCRLPSPAFQPRRGLTLVS